MIIYISLFLFIFIQLIYFERYKFNFKISFFYISCLFVFFFCAFREDVGGDWKRYDQLFHENIYFNFIDVIKFKEPLFQFISYVSFNLRDNIFVQNFIISIIFFLSILPFLVSRKNPFLSLLIFIPMGVYILHMGYVRQSIALSFLCLSIYLFEQNKIFKSYFFSILSFGFHYSSIVFYPFLLFKKSLYTNLFIFTLIISFILAIFIILYFKSDINFLNFNNINLVRSYLIQNESVSMGIYYRIIPTLIAFFIFLSYLKNFSKLENYGLLQYFSSLFVFIFCLMLFGFSTLADRINFYLIPYQIIIFNEYLSFSALNKKIKLLLISFMYFLILIIWLSLSKYSQSNWQNYSTIF